MVLVARGFIAIAVANKAENVHHGLVWACAGIISQIRGGGSRPHLIHGH